MTLVMTVFWLAIACSRSSEQENAGAARPAMEKASVVWQDFNTGLRLAKEQRKPVVMDFYADWCGWCKKMEAEVFEDGEVADKLKKNYITVRIHTDTRPDETIQYKNHVLTKQEFAMMLGVQGLPTVVFMDRDGNMITMIPGFVNKGMFLSLLGYIKDECYQKKVAFQDYIDGKAPCGK